jgi:hypothetical protein
MSNRPGFDAPPTARGASVEAAIFQAHEALTAVPVERRGSPRRQHRVFQWIAPCTGEGVPDESMFYQVQCIDISRTGIAFYTYAPLPSAEVIVAIGTTADAVYVRARVANCLPAVDSDGLRYRIGCEFIESLGPRPTGEPAAPAE